MQAAFTEATRWDVEHQVTAHWEKLRGAQAVVSQAEHNYPQFRAELQRAHPDLTDGQVEELIATAQLQIVECRAHVDDALARLSTSGDLGATAELVLRNRLKLVGLHAELFG
jgi:hypothetical protein